MKEVRGATKAMREKHHLENHAVYAEWCPVCVSAKGSGTQHRRRIFDSEAEKEGPRIFSDYFFMSTEEGGSKPMLALKFSRSGRMAATQLERKGVAAYGVKFFGRFIQQTGVRRFINLSDGEPAMKALKEASAQSNPHVEAISRETPVGDHQANGSIESAVRQLKSQMRALRLGLERRLGKVLAEDDPVLCWIATFAGDIIARYRKGSDGKTPWQRETGRRWAGEALEFGEKLFIKEAKERGGVAKKDWEPRLLEARYVGQHARTGVIMGLTSEGVVFGRLGRRVPEKERWSLEGWDSLRGVPWDMNPTGREQPRVVVEAQPGGAETIHVVRREVLPAVSRGEEGEGQSSKYEPLHREFYVTKGDIERFGPLEGCRACEHIKSGKPGRSKYTHSEACRERITGKLVEENSARVEAYMMRYAEKEEKKPKRRLGEDENTEEERPGSPKIPKEAPPKPAEKRGAEVSSDELREASTREREIHEQEREREEEEASAYHRSRQMMLERDAGRSAQREEEDRRERDAGRSAQREEEDRRERDAGRSAQRGEESRGERDAGGSAQRKEEGRGEREAGSTAQEQVQRRGEILTQASSAAVGPAPLQADLRLPPEVAQEPRRDVEDIIASMSLEVDPLINTIGSSDLGTQKHEMMELASLRIEHHNRQPEEEMLNDQELEELTAIMLELCSVDLVELFSPKRFVQQASSYGLRPGFAVDLCETKPYGRHKGEYWDLSKDSDVVELEQMIGYERPWLLTGSPPCTAFSSLQKISLHKRDPHLVRQERMHAEKLLEVAVHFYELQRSQGRFFLHEHPHGCDSWSHPLMIELQRKPGVFTVTSPMCCWEARLPGDEIGYIYKPTKWVTNSPRLAQALDRECTNKYEDRLLHRHTRLIGGVAHQAQAYAPKLVVTVLKAMRDEAKDQGWINSVDTKYGGPVPTDYLFSQNDGNDEQEVMEQYDTVTGEQLPPDLVAQGKKEEIAWTRSIGLYTKVPRSDAVKRGAKIIPVKWVVVNKGDAEHIKVRCRLVAKEIKAKTKEALLAHELFAAMPPWECIKSLFALMLCDHDHDEDMEIAVFDISRAHFMADMDRELYVEVVEEDRDENDGDIVGRLNKSMYGCRTASANWMRDWQALLGSVGCTVGTANPALFHDASQGVRGAVHGDDFVVLGRPRALKMIGDTLRTKYSVREAHRLGFRSGCERSAVILNRVVSLGHDAEGRRQIVIEPDFRHVQLVLQDLGLDKENTKSLTTPTIKIDEMEVERRKLEQPLDRSMTTTYRSCVMRLSFLSQDRADLGEPVKTLARQMAKPTQGSMQDLKRVARYLRYKPSMGLIFTEQKMPRYLDIYVDSDFAACKRTRRSTTGMVVQLGSSTIKASSNMQTSVGLNVSECEYYALVHGASHGLGLQAYLKDLGFDFAIRIYSDSSSARALSNRKGLGKQRHVQTRYLWLQERVALRHLEVKKIATKENLSDILTKSCNRETLERHCTSMGLKEVSPHRLQKKALGSKVAGSSAPRSKDQVIAGSLASLKTTQSDATSAHPEPRRGAELPSAHVETALSGASIAGSK